jgi:CRISPR-associated endonuclease Csn1
MDNEQVLGLDLGTNSIGATLREGNTFIWGAVYTFSKGFGMSKSGEFSLAAQRTGYRSKRRLYNSRRYRKWTLLEELIKKDYCPLSMGKLNDWRYYKKGSGRRYPVDDIEFQHWIRMDFDVDGTSDYSSPFQLRAFLADNKIDMSKPVNRYKLGRVLYHMAMRRGFKSSRKSGKNEESSVYKGSSDTNAIPYNKYKEQVLKHGTLGKYLASIEDGDTRLRNRYTLRSDYLAEFRVIMATQDLQNTAFAKACETAIFFQRPLRSQKGLVGKCPLEPNKARCPESHPDFEFFRAHQFLNHLKFKNASGEFEQLPAEWRDKIYQQRFTKLDDTCKFGDIRKAIHKIAGKEVELNYKRKRDDTTVSLCPTRSRIESIFGKYENIKVERPGTSKSGKKYLTGEDIWHAMFHFEDKELFEEYCRNTLKLDDKNTKSMLTGWKGLRVGYSNLSLKAIRKISVPLELGSIYSEAVLLAKVIDFIGEKKFKEDYQILLKELDAISSDIEFDRISTRLANKLLFLSKIEEGEDIFNEQIVTEEAIALLGKSKWNSFEESKQTSTVQDALEKFEIHRIKKAEGTTIRSTILSKNTVSEFAKVLSDIFDLNEDKVSKELYHHSNISYYPDIKSDPTRENQLPSPIIPALKNPAAYKTLHKLRRIINDLLAEGVITEHTRIVIEVARSMSSKNERNAIERYQNEKARVNASAIAVLAEAEKDYDFNGLVSPKSARDLEKFKLWREQIPGFEKVVKLITEHKDALDRYQLWKEQKGICFYTGKTISFSALFSPNLVDFEHTIPASVSFDDSLANKTVTFHKVNAWKDDRIPTELDNFSDAIDDRGSISARLDEWREIEKRLFISISALSAKIKATEDPDKKAKIIQERHIKRFEHKYWERKLECFEIEKDKVNEGFRNSQLIDTQIITKYAFHFLKTIFYRVDPQVGQTTSLFKEIYSVGEPNTDKKDRSKHSHHLEDAAVLTLVPRRTRLKKIMEAYFTAKENGTTFYTGHLTVGTSGISNAIRELVENTLVNNLTRQDRTFQDVFKKVRKRGKIQYKDKKKTDPYVATGDAVRGQLHQETFYGKIKIAEKDGKGSLKRYDDGSIVYKQENGRDLYWMVIRKPIEDVNFKSDVIVDDAIAVHLKKQIVDGVKQSELKDFQGNTLGHLRVRVKAGRGFMKPENATEIKEQTYKSEKDHKNSYYTNSGDNYLFGLYETKAGDRTIVPINLMDGANLHTSLTIQNKNEYFEKSIENVGRSKATGKLIHVFQVGQKVLFIDKNVILEDFETSELSKKLYFVKRLADAAQGLVQFQHHLEARSDTELREAYGAKGVNGFSKFDENDTKPRLLLSVSNMNFLIEDIDFSFDSVGRILRLSL